MSQVAEQKKSSMTLVWNGVVIESRESDDFINATQLCRAGKKKLAHWYETLTAKRLIQKLQERERLNIGNTTLNVIDKKVGGNHSGTWIHPDLAIQLAQWIDADFALEVSGWIRTLLTTGKVELKSKEATQGLSLQVASLQQQLDIERKEKEAERREKEEERKKNEKLRIRVVNLSVYSNNFKELEKEQVFYLVTTEAYALQHRFKFGGVKTEKDLVSRLNSYNTGKAEGDLFFYVKIVKCNNYKMIEERIHNVLGRFKDKQNSRKEMLYLRYDLLEKAIDFICDNYDREIDFINEHCKNFLDTTLDTDEAKVPPAITLGNSLEMTVRRNGTVTRQEVVDISTWSEQKIDEVFNEVIDKCAKKQLPNYNYQRDRDKIPILLEWKSLSTLLRSYSTSMSLWRTTFKEWYQRKPPKQLKLRGIAV